MNEPANPHQTIYIPEGVRGLILAALIIFCSVGLIYAGLLDSPTLLHAAKLIAIFVGLAFAVVVIVAALFAPPPVRRGRGAAARERPVRPRSNFGPRVATAALSVVGGSILGFASGAAPSIARRAAWSVGWTALMLLVLLGPAYLGDLRRSRLRASRRATAGSPGLWDREMDAFS